MWPSDQRRPISPLALLTTTETIEEQGGGGPQVGEPSAPPSSRDIGHQVAHSPPSSQWHLSQENALTQGVAQYAQIPIDNGKMQGLMPHVPEFQHSGHPGNAIEAEARKVVVLGCARADACRLSIINN